MSPRFPRILLCLKIAATAIVLPNISYAQDTGTTVGLAAWEKTAAGPQLHVKLVDSLSPKQKNMINSGFSTYSDVRLTTRNESPDATTLRCTVKFDTWEEFYDIIQLTNGVRRLRSPTFNEYATSCLTLRVPLTDLPPDILGRGGLVTAKLAMNPISQEKAGEIRSWMINQQSGVIQNLFSHMIGDLKLDELVDISIQVPPYSDKDSAQAPIK